jgi:leader peptidase (prepilin peptidase) / N-methyltransferase
VPIGGRVTVALLAICGCCLGASLASFLNVVISRVPMGLSVVHPRSACPSCHTQIAGRHNIPVVSWCQLRGRCAACAWPIPARYVLVELAGAVLGAAVGAALAVIALRMGAVS